VAPVFGGLSHLSMVLFLKRAGLEMTPVSYKGDCCFVLCRAVSHSAVLFGFSAISG
jgi:hypothetical protein